MILTKCSSTSSPNVESHLHDVLWPRWAGGIHTEAIVMLTQRGMNRQTEAIVMLTQRGKNRQTEAIVMLTQRGMNRQCTATRVSGSLHRWHVQLILTWQGRNDDQEGRSPTAS